MIQSIDSKEMSLKSLKHYRTGDVVLTAKPLVYVVVDQMKARLCDYCLSFKSSLISCTVCQQMFYCNQICLQNDWTYHRLECHTYANSPHMTSSTKIMIRLWFIVNNMKTIGVKSLPNGQYLCLNEMKVNGNIGDDVIKLMDESIDDSVLDSDDKTKNISVEDIAILQFRALVETFTECQLAADLPQLWKLFLRVWSNVLKIEVVDSDSADNAYGLYVEPSALSHSCEPNACYVSYGTQLQVRAIKAIKPNEKITISYIDSANRKSIRSQLLMSYFIANCDCLKCQINSDSTLKYEVFHELKEEFNQLVAAAKEDINGDKQVLLAIADKLVPFYDSIYVDYSPEMSLFLLKYLKIMLLNVSQHKKSVINRQFLSFVLQNIRITHGIDHKIYRKLPIVSNVTLLDLELDTDRVLRTLRSKPMSTLHKYLIRALLLFVLIFVIYYNFDWIAKQLFI